MLVPKETNVLAILNFTCIMALFSNNQLWLGVMRIISLAIIIWITCRVAWRIILEQQSKSQQQ